MVLHITYCSVPDTGGVDMAPDPDSYHWIKDLDLDPDLAFFSSGIQDVKNIFFSLNFFG